MNFLKKLITLHSFVPGITITSHFLNQHKLEPIGPRNCFIVKFLKVSFLATFVDRCSYDIVSVRRDISVIAGNLKVSDKKERATAVQCGQKFERSFCVCEFHVNFSTLAHYTYSIHYW